MPYDNIFLFHLVPPFLSSFLIICLNLLLFLIVSGNPKQGLMVYSLFTYLFIEWHFYCKHIFLPEAKEKCTPAPHRQTPLPCSTLMMRYIHSRESKTTPIYCKISSPGTLVPGLFFFFIPIIPSLKLGLAVQDQTKVKCSLPSGRIPFRQSINFSTLEEEMLCPRRCCAPEGPPAAFRAYWLVFAPAISHPGFWSHWAWVSRNTSGIQALPCGVSPLVLCCFLPHTMYSGDAHSFQALTQKIPAKLSSGACSSWEPARAQVHLQSSICDDCSDRRLFKDSGWEKWSFSCRFQKTSSVGLSTRKCVGSRD